MNIGIICADGNLHWFTPATLETSITQEDSLWSVSANGVVLKSGLASEAAAKLAIRNLAKRIKDGGETVIILDDDF